MMVVNAQQSSVILEDFCISVNSAKYQIRLLGKTTSFTCQEETSFYQPGISIAVEILMKRHFSMTVAPSAMPSIDPSRDCYPYCLVWSPLPVITWFLPFIGHTGIGDSNGVIHDFAGPFTINVGNFAFGKATRYIQLDPAKCCSRDWDSGIREGCEVYRGRMHNLFLDNCHSHVGKCLQVMGYDRKSNFGMVKICFWFFFHGKFVSPAAFVKTYLPFCIIVMIILVSSGVFF